MALRPRGSGSTGARAVLGGVSALGLAALLLAGCVAYEPRPIVPARSLEEFEARRLDAPELGDLVRARRPQAAWPPASWDLEDLTLAGFFYSPVLDEARARWAVARGGVVTAGARANPSLGAAVGYNATTDSREITPWIPEAALDLPLGIAGKRGIRIEAARRLSEAARWNVLTAAWEVRSSVRRAFAALWAAGERERLLTRRLEIDETSARILEAQVAEGEVSPYQLTQARVALDSGRLAALAAAGRRQRARGELAAAVGVPIAALDGIAWSFEALGRSDPEPPADGIRRQALINRSDVRASLAAYEASQSALELEIRKQYPSFRLGPGYQLDQTDSKWTLALGLALPVLDRNRGPIAEAQARRQEAAAQFLSLQARVVAELDGALLAIRATAREVAAADELLTVLARRERIARASYEAGEISRLELLGVEAERVTAELGRLDAAARAEEAIGALEDAMQSPLEVESWTLEAPARASDAAPPARPEGT